MSRTFMRHKWLSAAAVLAALTVFWAVSHGTTPAQAQASPFVRAFNFGPVTLGLGQSFSVSYSNLFGSRPYAVRARFFNAGTGDVLLDQSQTVGPGTVFAPTVMPVPPCPNPPCNQSLSSLAAGASALVAVVGVLELADPRPTPVVSIQVVGAGGVVALADPRPTPLADPRPTP